MNRKYGLTTRGSGWTPLTELRREMDKLFDDFWQPASAESSAGWGGDFQFTPACEISEEDNYYLVSLEVPGISKDDIKIEVLDNQVVISGERRQEKSASEKGGWYSERSFGKFQRSFALPPGVSADKVEADYKDGVLKMAIPKAEAAQPKQIKISSGSGTGFFGKLLGQAKEKSEPGKSDKVA